MAQVSDWSPGDIHLRLNGCVILYEGQPYICSVDGEVLHLAHVYAANRHVHRIGPPYQGVDINNFELGYVQVGTNVCYLSRYARRSARHGLQQESLVHRWVIENNPGRSSVIKTQGFHDMVVGNYPSLHEAKATISQSRETIAIAVSKRVVLSKLAGRDVIEVHYKGEFVGWMRENSNRLNVPTSEKAAIVSMFLIDLGFDWEVN